MIFENVRALLLSVIFFAVVAPIAGAADAASPSETSPRDPVPSPAVADPRAGSWRDTDRWSYQVGVAYITGSTIDELLLVNGKFARGPAAGQIYLLQASYKAAELHPELLGRRVAIDVELPLVLGVVNEHGSDAFMQYSGGATLRWKQFPWNKWLYTNLETGIGLTYSQHVLQTERERHSDRQRSHLEFYWPVQLMLAHPRHREHQFAIFLHHHSGGWVFHEGGANSLGIGYRYVPGER